MSVNTRHHNRRQILLLALKTLSPPRVSSLYGRAIYFAAYSTAKEKLNGVLEPDSTQVHMVSAGMAGKCVCVCVCF